MRNVYMDNLILHIQDLENLASTESAYVSKPLLSYILRWLNLDNNDKKEDGTDFTVFPIILMYSLEENISRA